MAGQKVASPIVVLAAAGSGGALLAHALGAHGQLHGLDDGHLCARLLAELDDPASGPEGQTGFRSRLDDDVAKRGIARIGATDQEAAIAELVATMSQARGGDGAQSIAGELVRRLAGGRAEKAGKAGFVLHAAGCAPRAAALARALPDASIIHLIRDGRVIALRGAHSGSEPMGLGPAGRAWLAEIEPVLRLAAANPDRVINVAYEDLLQEPERELGELCGALGLSPAPGAMAAALHDVLAEDDAVGFRPDLLDAWQIVELERELQPLLALLGYRPATDFAEIARIRAQAEACDRAQRDAQTLRERLALYEHSEEGEQAGEGATPMDPEASDLARRYEDALDELRRLRSQMRGQQDPEITTLRWKAKRYDQIRAMASPALRLRRRRSGR